MRRFDREQAELHLKLLFDGLTDGYLTARFPQRAGKTEQAYALPDGLTRFLTDAEGEVDQQHDVYLSLLPHTTRRRIKGNAMPGRAVWADIDHLPSDEQAELLARLGAVWVESGTAEHVHAYVPLSEPTDVTEIEVMNQALRDRVGGDAKWSADSLLRLAGTANFKDGVGQPVVMVNLNGRKPLPVDQVRALLGRAQMALPLAGNDRPLEAAPVPESVPAPVQRALEVALGKDDRSDAHAGLVWTALDEGWSEAQTLGFVLDRFPPAVAKYGRGDALAADVRRLVSKWPGKKQRAKAPGRVVPPPDDPLAVARAFLSARYANTDGDALLRHWRGGFYAYDGQCWPEDEDARIRADLYEWLESSVYVKDDSYEKWKPTRYRTTDVLDAVHAAAHLPARIDAPTWLDEVDHPAADEIVTMANGLLHLPTRKLQPHTPALFSQHSLSFGYQPKAATPKRWYRFLAELWEDDAESIATLAEVMGYVLSGDTGQQKLFMIVGPKRSGKGTVARVLEGLFGAHNVAAPTLSSLTSNFGLQPLIGRLLAVISDARIGTRVDSLVAVERLLSISGEDSLTVDRKYRDAWTGRLPSRFLILTNELPRLTDSSGALVSRFVVLVLRNSFYGREDPLLTRALLDEAPGIFNWSLEGLDRLRDRGHFVQPEAARDAVRQLEDMSSPVAAFLRDRCELGPTHEIDKQELFEAWRSWCMTEGREPGSAAVFGRDLVASAPGVRAVRPGSRQERRRVYRGVRLQGRLL